MSSRFLLLDSGLVAVAALSTAALLVSCGRGNAESKAPPLATTQVPNNVALTGLFPGGGAPPAEDPHGKLYDGNTDAINAGQRLFDWYNCSGCHFHGAGGIGPAFMLLSTNSVYGDRIDQIYASIYQGRPNGMPSWGDKIPAKEIWQIAAYVRSLDKIGATTPEPTAKPPAVSGPDTLETQPAKNPEG